MPIINQVLPEDSLLVAEALLVGGVEIMEITLRSDKAKESLVAVRKKFPEIVLGAGSVVNPEQLEWIQGEGLDFAVAPGWSDECWQKANTLNLTFIPGILTPSELIKAIDAGCLNPKIFPVEPVGGISYVKSLLVFKFPILIELLFSIDCVIIVGMAALKDCLGPKVLNGLKIIEGKPKLR